MRVCEIKICGLTRGADVASAVAAGVDYIGFVCVENSPRRVAVGRLGELAGIVPRESSVRRVGVFRNATLEEIRRAVALGRLDVIQLHGSEPPAFAEEAARYAEVWKAFSLRFDGELAFAAGYPAARIICDGSSPGSGIPCDWELARRLAARGISVMLAGGITPKNARRAWETVRCVGVDVAGGVEAAPGIKDRKKLLELTGELRFRRAFRNLGKESCRS